MSEVKKVKVLLVATEKEINDIIEEACQNCDFQYINTNEEFDEKYEEFNDGEFAFSVCGTKLGIPFSYEVAQIIRNQCPETPSFFISLDKRSFIEKTMLKNGFSRAYLMPLDKELF